MFSINTRLLISESKKSGAKIHLARTNESVFNSIKLSFINLIDAISEYAVYNAAHWSCYINGWIKNTSYNNTKTYKRGDILVVDLGAQNYGHEPSYIHTSVVLANRYDSILIVPCSTKQHGTNHRGIIDATTNDGFNKNTGIQSENFRWISKNRVISETGCKVSSNILTQLDEVLLSFAPSIKNRIKQLENN